MITSIPREDNRGWEHRIGGCLSNNERRNLLARFVACSDPAEGECKTNQVHSLL